MIRHFLYRVGKSRNKLLSEMFNRYGSTYKRVHQYPMINLHEKLILTARSHCCMGRRSPMIRRFQSCVGKPLSKFPYEAFYRGLRLDELTCIQLSSFLTNFHIPPSCTTAWKGG